MKSSDMRAKCYMHTNNLYKMSINIQNVHLNTGRRGIHPNWAWQICQHSKHGTEKLFLPHSYVLLFPSSWTKARIWWWEGFDKAKLKTGQAVAETLWAALVQLLVAETSELIRLCNRKQPASFPRPSPAVPMSSRGMFLRPPPSKDLNSDLRVNQPKRTFPSQDQRASLIRGNHPFSSNFF